VVVKLPPPINSAIRRDRNTIPVFIPMFSGVKFSMAPLETLSDETGSQKSKMAAAKPKLNVAQFLYTIYEITFISASIHDSNEIPTAIPMFSRSGDTTKLLRRLSGM